MQGDVQIFADEDCTQYPNGVLTELYARINVPWTGLDSGWNDTEASYTLYANSPETEAPNDPYNIGIRQDNEVLISSEDFNNPFNVGQIIHLEGDEMTFNGHALIFSK